MAKGIFADGFADLRSSSAPRHAKMQTGATCIGASMQQRESTRARGEEETRIWGLGFGVWGLGFGIEVVRATVL